MDRQLYTNEAALNEAAVIQKNLADSGATPAVVAKLRLIGPGFTPTTTTTKAELVAAEIVLVGYPSGGYDITDFTNPNFAPGGGAVIISEPLVQVAYVSGSATTCAGYWLEDAAGEVRDTYIYSPERVLGVVGDGWPILIQLGYGRNA